ncbi:uncharacterized protein VICG_01806 [Vittaforma corneae ATCC 50505]|uniref:Protein transport protein SEC31 n=1 Tax=Vittaforma corneae (strain ATCC 50505) TaxID=993615 RepID=L2GLQ1_VITCO|nr:uncharacterized protein VICG_01806 [Vittaforma corneae ATCC 50505]ELA41207.1 hypothetical protein VICG_01806 [Vittaforma corneae ATCC 50505]
MEINKRCISAFAKNEPFVALATKSKLFDPTFSLTSELILVDYMSGKIYPAVTTELKFCKILWCEFGEFQYLVAGHENGVISIYNRTEDGLALLKSKQCLEDDITALDFLASKAVLVAGSSKGKIVFWTLSNMEKEYALDIPISISISAIAWNPKVSKILCVGSADGVIKVLDIKKNSVIMTLNSKEFSEVRHLEWDPENNTKLNVMSEKGYITIFDLSNDTVTKLGDHKDPIIGFYRDIIVSKSQIEVGGTFIKVSDSFECAISKRDPVLSLSYVSGSTNVISIPVMRKTVPFCRVSRYLYTPASKFEIKVVNAAEAPSMDAFYHSLLEMVYSAKSLEEVAEYLLSNSKNVPRDLVDRKANIDIDINDPHTLDFIHGNIENLKTSKTSLNLGALECLFSKNTSCLAAITDFRIVYVLCRLLNDYDALSRISNPRLLATLLIFNKIKKFDLLSNSREGRILKAILTKDYGMYIDSRVPPNISYLKQMKMLEALFKEIEPFITEPVRSSKLSEYFWYKVFIDGPKSVEYLNISDPNIQFYVKMQTSQVLSDRMKGLSVKSAPVDQSPHRIQQPPMPSSSQLSYNMLQSKQPSCNVASAPQQGFNVPQQRPSQPSFSVPTAPQQSFNVPQQRPSQPSFSVLTAPQQSFNVPQQRPSQPSFGTPSQLGLGVSQQGAFIPKNQQAADFGQGPVSGAVYPAPAQPSFTVPPKSPYLPQRQISTPAAGYPNIPQPNPQATPAPFKSFSPSGFSGIPQRSVPQMPSSPRGQLQNIPSKPTDQIQVENADKIASDFTHLVSEIRQKADANKSLILRQRKQQYLNALSPYDSLDKSRLPPLVLHVMDLVSKRVAAADDNMKSDLDILVDGYNDVVWLKAAVELIKMVY